MKNKKRFLELVDRNDPSTMADVKFRIGNREMLRESQDIALKVLVRLDELKWSQVDLAKKMKVVPQQITKILSGKTNFEIQTLLKLQIILNIPLLASYKVKQKVVKKNVLRIHKVSIRFKPSRTLPSNYTNFYRVRGIHKSQYNAVKGNYSSKILV